MNTKPSPRGLPSTTAPTVTQAMPASVYGNQARAALDGAAFMTVRLTREAERLARRLRRFGFEGEPGLGEECRGPSARIAAWLVVLFGGQLIELVEQLAERIPGEHGLAVRLGDAARARCLSTANGTARSTTR
jgi:hypothetical protein